MSTSEPYPGCGGIQPNSDIAGIGVRVAFYLQAIAAAVQSVQSSDDDSASWYSAVLTSAGLVITAFIFAQQGQLDLYHAILVTLLATLQLIAQGTITLGRMVRLYSARQADNSTGFSCLIGNFMNICLVLTVYLWVWIDVTEFGSQPECNLYINISLVVTTINVTNHGLRIFVLIGSSYVGGVFLALCLIPLSENWWLCFLPKLLSFVCFTADKRLSYRNMYNALYIRCRLQVVGEIFESEQIKPRKPPEGAIDCLPVVEPLSRTQVLKLIINESLQGIYFLWFIIIYLICITERTIAVNAILVLPGEDDWQFGQVLSLLLAAVPMISILSWTTSYSLHEQLKARVRLRILHAGDISLYQPNNPNEAFCLVLLVSAGDKDYGSIQIPCAAAQADIPSSWLDLPVDEKTILSFSMYRVGTAHHFLRTGYMTALGRMLLLQRVASRAVFLLTHITPGGSERCNEMNLFRGQFWSAPAQPLGTTLLLTHAYYPSYMEEEVLFQTPLKSVSPSPFSVSPLKLMFSLKPSPYSGPNIRPSTLHAEALRFDVIFRNASHRDPIPQQLTITFNDAIRIGQKTCTLSRMDQGEATGTFGSRAQPNGSSSHRPVTLSTARTSWREMIVRGVERVRVALSSYPILQQLISIRPGGNFGYEPEMVARAVERVRVTFSSYPLLQQLIDPLLQRLIPIRLRDSETSSYEHSSHHRTEYDIAFLAEVHAEIVLFPLASRHGTDAHNVQFLIRCWGPTRLNGSLIRASTDEQTFYFPLEDDSIIELWDIRYAEQSLPEGNDEQRLALRFNFTVPIDAQV